MKLQCKELQGETTRFMVGRAYSVERHGSDFVKLIDENGGRWLVSLDNLKVNINGLSGDYARYALFRRSHA
jgi:hypothetical protein